MLYSMDKDIIYFDHRVNMEITVTAKGESHYTQTRRTFCANVSLNISGIGLKYTNGQACCAETKHTHLHECTHTFTNTLTDKEAHTDPGD